MLEKIEIKDNINDISVKYLLIKNWQWTDMLDKEKYQGAPIPGRVYRAVYNTKTKSYRLVLMENPMNGLLIQDINCSNEMEGFTSEVVTLTKENLLTQNIKEEDLDKIIAWMENKNNDLFNNQPTPNFPLLLMEHLSSAEYEQEMEEANRMAYAIEALSDLDSVNSLQFVSVIEIAEKLYEYNTQQIPDLTDLSLDENHGCGVNLSRAMELLKRYTNPKKKIGDDKEDLMMAIVHLTIELERRLFHEKDEE